MGWEFRSYLLYTYRGLVPKNWTPIVIMNTTKGHYYD